MIVIVAKGFAGIDKLIVVVVMVNKLIVAFTKGIVLFAKAIVFFISSIV